MIDSGTVQGTVVPIATGRSRWQRFIRNRSLAVGGCLSAAVILMALAAPVLAPYDPLAVHPNHTLEGPSRAFPLGTDDLGRDNLSQDIYGSRISLIVGLGPWRSAPPGACRGDWRAASSAASSGIS